MISINPRQANFLRAFERAHGRPETVTRANLLAFMAGCGKDKKGPFGFVLRLPAWMTNSGTFSAGRGVYLLPWEAYDQWLKENEPTDQWTGTVVQPGYGVLQLTTAELNEKLAKARGDQEPPQTEEPNEPKADDRSDMVGMVS
jgi:hypothetical protein